MSTHREAANAAKAVRRGIEEPRPVGGRKRQDKPIVVESRWPGCSVRAWRDWSTFRRYASSEIAESEMANQQRKHPKSEYRIKP